MSFQSPSSKESFVPSSINNWIFSLHGFQCLFKLLQKDGFKYLFPRRLNQDPLEIFFVGIGNHGELGTLILHAVPLFLPLDSYYVTALDTLKHFITKDEEVPFLPPDAPKPGYLFGSSSNKSVFGECGVTYITGYVAKK
ncbi:hypothetical protein ILUMI_08644, partial [Ignelater luminosus]